MGIHPQNEGGYHHPRHEMTWSDFVARDTVARCHAEMGGQVPKRLHLYLSRGVHGDLRTNCIASERVMM